MTMMLREMEKTMSMSCSQKRMVRPRVRASRLMSSIVAKVSSGDMPAVGSSRMSSSGSFPRAMAISRIFWSPWEREPTMWFSLPASPRSPEDSGSPPRPDFERAARGRCSFADGIGPPPERFRMTVSRGKTLTIWKDRLIPRLQISKGGSPLISSPLNNTLPPVPRRMPVMRLKRVVFPAPLGPMTATISPF